jgi:hypothetical protein
MIWMQRLLRATFRILGPERYGVLMAYFGYISSLRNQRDVFFGASNGTETAARSLSTSSAEGRDALT